MFSKVTFRLLTPLFISCIYLSHLAAQTFWERDPGFNNGNTVRIGGGREEEAVHSLAVLPGGKILAAGTYSGDKCLIMARYHPNGQLDASFGSNGKSGFQLGSYYSTAKEILLLPDGRFILGTSSTGILGGEVFSLLRFLPHGVPDSTFGVYGVARSASATDVFDKLNAIALQPDGKILAAGSTNSQDGAEDDQSVTLHRFTTSGGIDYSFGTNGVVRLPYPGQQYEFNAVAVQADGRIVAAGSNLDRIIVARFLPNGLVDSTFGANGVRFLQYTASGKTRCGALTLLPDGKILLGAWCWEYWYNNGAIAIRLLSDGALDPTFHNNGMSFIHSDYQLNTSSMALQSDGKIVLAAAGLNNDPNPIASIFRFSATGAPDSSFATNGEWFGPVGSESSAFYAVHATPDGKILAGGVSKKYLDYDFTLLRLLNNGAADLNFGDNGLTITDFCWGPDWVSSVHARPGGKVMIASNAYASGDFVLQDKCVLTQFLPDGAPDGGFGNVGKDSFPGGALKTVAFQQDGKILVGSDNYWDGYVRPATLFRRLANGGTDSTFGQFGQVDSIFANYFAPTIAQADVLPNGKIVVTGRVSRPGTNRDFILACFNPDGTRDLTFGNNGFVLVDFNNKNDQVFGLLVQADNKILLGGTAWNGNAAKRDVVVMRFLANGTFDNTWGQNGILFADFEGLIDESITCMTFAPDGKLVLAAQRQMTSDAPAFHNIIARYKLNGTPDAAFGNNGRIVMPLAPAYSDTRYIRQIRFFPDNKFMTAAYRPPVSMDFDSFSIELQRYTANGIADTTPSSYYVINEKWGEDFRGLGLDMSAAEGFIWLAGGSLFDNRFNEDMVLARYRFEVGCFPVSVQSVNGKALNNTTLSISPSPSCPAMTLQTGCDDEPVCLCGKGALFIVPSNNDNPLNGVSTFDLLLISKHILGLTPFTSPYQIIAADANRSGSVTTFDLVEIRKLILGVYQNYPNSTSWRFVRKDYVFPNPANPFSPPFPEKDTVSALDPPAGLAYFAVKTGDVNNTHLTGCDNFIEPAEPRQSFSFQAPVCAVEAGDRLTVPVAFTADASIAAWQCALRFDAAALELVAVEPGETAGMDAGNFGRTDAGRGIFRAIWYSENGREQQMTAGKTLFRLIFRAKKDIVSSEEYLTTDETILACRAFKANGDAMKLTLDSRSQPCAAAARPPVGLRSLPNPVGESVCFQVEQGAAFKGELRIYNANGTVYFRQILDSATTPEYCLSDMNTWPAGMYTWHFISDRGEAAEGKFLKQY